MCPVIVQILMDQAEQEIRVQGDTQNQCTYHGGGEFTQDPLRQKE